MIKLSGPISAAEVLPAFPAAPPKARFMVVLIIDEEICGPKLPRLPKTIKTAFWDYVERVQQNPDDPDLGPWEERKGYRASQFTSGWILDWEVIREETNILVDLSFGTPLAVKLWNVREVKAPEAPGLVARLWGGK